MRALVLSGEVRPMVHQIPTPVMAPNTIVSSTKKRVSSRR